MSRILDDNLIKRINILDSDYERVIRIEISHHLRYLINEIGEVFLNNKMFELVSFVNSKG